MAKPKPSRCRRKFPALEIRNMDLHGIGKDGCLYLWRASADVLPVSRFERRGGLIVSGHYVIERDGRAVTVHCGNQTDGRISLQFMCGGVGTMALSRADVEGMLLGRVVPDPVAESEITRKLIEALEMRTRDKTAPHLRYQSP